MSCDTHDIRRAGRIITTLTAVAAGVVCTAATAQNDAWPQYELIDLGTLGGEHSQALDVNERRVVVGWSEVGPPTNGTQAFVWRDSQMRPIGTLGGAWSQAMSVNDRGQVVGSSETANGEVHAFYWFDGEILDLNALVAPGLDGKGFDVLGEATAINADGAVVGCGHVGERLRGFVLTPRTDDPYAPRYDVADLGELRGASGCMPSDVNGMNAVVGTSGVWPFLWQDGVMEPLEHFTSSPFYCAAANAINDFGVAVGWQTRGNDWRHVACRWDGGLRLDLRYEDCVTEATDINNRGVAVGFAVPPAGTSVAVRWTGVEATNLNAVTAVPLAPDAAFPPGFMFVWSNLDHATAINDEGVIVGHGRSSDGRTHGFLLRPLPPRDVAAGGHGP